ncbi:hypothetical protein QFZ72_004125 [Bacillus sp. V2I10]|nr:hypothetical protein [Bacillus sp. V2I10]
MTVIAIPVALSPASEAAKAPAPPQSFRLTCNFHKSIIIKQKEQKFQLNLKIMIEENQT